MNVRPVQGARTNPNQWLRDTPQWWKSCQATVSAHTHRLLYGLISWKVHPQVMAECLSRMPRLQNLTVWSGEALEGNGRLVHENCHVFKALRFYGWYYNLPVTWKSQDLYDTGNILRQTPI